MLVTDKKGGVHARLKLEINGLEVMGAAVVLHTEADGTVYAANGDFVSGSGVAFEPDLDADTAIEIALGQAGINKSTKIGEATLTNVYGFDKSVYLAWMHLIEYTIDMPGEGGGLHRDKIFAHAQLGDWVATHPQIMGSGVATLETRVCNSGISLLSLLATPQI
jgi:Zn-dependent metalloprotease